MEEQMKALTEQLQDLQATVIAHQAMLLWLLVKSTEKSWLPEVEIQGFAAQFLEGQAHSSLPDAVLYSARQKIEQLTQTLTAMQR